MDSIPTPTVKKRDRSVYLDYDVTKDGQHPRCIVRLHVYHSKDWKMFRASVNRMETDGVMERTAFSFRGPSVQLPSQPAARFSQKALEAYAKATLLRFEDLVAAGDPDALAMLDNSDPDRWI